MKASQFWSVENVYEFKGHEVSNGQVDVSDDAYANYVDDFNDAVTVCGMVFNASRIIQELDPIAWRCGIREWESQLQSELEEQLSREDSDNIEFIDGDEFELDEDDEF